jgi:hypothetical protein
MHACKQQEAGGKLLDKQREAGGRLLGKKAGSTWKNGGTHGNTPRLALPKFLQDMLLNWLERLREYRCESWYTCRFEMSACFFCTIAYLPWFPGLSSGLYELCSAAWQRFETVGIGFRQRCEEGRTIPALCPEKSS